MVNRLRIHASPAVYCTILPLAASDFPPIRTPARAHAEPSRRLRVRVRVSSRLDAALNQVRIEAVPGELVATEGARKETAFVGYGLRVDDESTLQPHSRMAV